MKFLVYQVTNIETGQYYRGRTTDDNWSIIHARTNVRVVKDINRLGIKLFKFEILHSFDNQQAALHKLNKIIITKAQDPLSYNRSRRSNGHQHGKTHPNKGNKKLSKKLKIITNSKEFKDKSRKTRAARKKVMTDEILLLLESSHDITWIFDNAKHKTSRRQILFIMREQGIKSANPITVQRYKKNKEILRVIIEEHGLDNLTYQKLRSLVPEDFPHTSNEIFDRYFEDLGIDFKNEKHTDQRIAIEEILEREGEMTSIPTILKMLYYDYKIESTKCIVHGILRKLK